MNSQPPVSIETGFYAQLDALERHPSPVYRFYQVYNQLHRDNLALLDELYEEDVIFEDPIHRLQSLQALRDYFTRLYSNVQHCHFEFQQACVSEHHAYTTWVMHVQHPKLNGGRRYKVEGTSFIQFEEKIALHRDFLDGGQLLYEKLPVLGKLLQYVKQRAALS